MRLNFFSFLLASAALAAFAMPARSQTATTAFDSDANLTGTYYFRYVVYFDDPSALNIQKACSLTGTMTFDGAGNYTIASSTLYDSAPSTDACPTTPSNGTYGLTSNGLAYLINPLNTGATLEGTFSQPVLMGSSTEFAGDSSGYIFNDLFVAIQAPTGGFSNSSLSGNYQVAAFEYMNAQEAYARQSWFTLAANGSGGIGTITVNGSAENIGTSATTQTVSGATYSVTSNGTGTLNLPLVGSTTAANSLVSGAKTLYVSADGNYVLGGSTTGLDFLFGFKAVTGGAGSNSIFNGTYFVAGYDNDLSDLVDGNVNPDSFYGSVAAGNGTGNQVWHERINYIEYSEDLTFNDETSINSSGVSQDDFATRVYGSNGQAFFLIGNTDYYSFNIGVRAPSYTSTGSVWINPVGVVNAANYSSITNSYAPGELVDIYGNFAGVAETFAPSLPLPTTLQNLQVTVNGIAAPLYLVSATQIAAFIPFEVSGDTLTFQVTVNGSASNNVSVYYGDSAPGIYTLSENGIGEGAILHADYSVVSASHPAVAGETLQMYVTGLGTVTPQIADGAADPSNPLSTVDDQNVYIFVDGIQAVLTYVGLAPGQVTSLYQVNFVMPSGTDSGDVYIDLGTTDADTVMATVNVSP